jgi:glycosyltransferase involved in cell wall biosynthesis
VRGSIIISVLESYEVVRRQVLHLARILPEFPGWELILVDDGSDPAIEVEISAGCPCRVLQTHDTRPWSQPAGRNFGAAHSEADWLLMTDIDHIITREAVRAVDRYDGDKIHFDRAIGILDERGELVTDRGVLEHYGLQPGQPTTICEHYNTFGIRRSIFELMGGYDDKYCGRHGGDDVDFSHRYGKLHYAGQVARSKSHAALVYAFPDPARDPLRIFHSLRRGTK